jgi:hypothetical protein
MTQILDTHIRKYHNETLYSFIYFAVLELELGAYTLSHSTSPLFCEVFFKVGSWALFAGTSFEP